MAVRNNKIDSLDNIYFITFTILGWRNVFTEDRYCDLVYKWFDYIKNKYGNKIYGYVIMPNHIHAIIKVSSISVPLSTLIMNAKRFLAYEIVDLLEKDKRINLLDFFKKHARIKDKAKHKVFTDRYDSLIIQSEKFFLQKLNYIHRNPLKENWKLAENPEDYEHSSASNYILGRGRYKVDVMEF